MTSGTDFVGNSSGDPIHILFNPRRIKTLYQRAWTNSTVNNVNNNYQGEADGGSVIVQKRGYARIKVNQMLNNYSEGGSNNDWKTLAFDPVASRNIFANLWSNNMSTDLEGAKWILQVLYVIDRLA